MLNFLHIQEKSLVSGLRGERRDPKHVKTGIGKRAAMSDHESDRGLVCAEPVFHVKPVDRQVVVFKPGGVSC